MMLLLPGRQRRTELHGEAADCDRPQQGAPDGRHRPDPGPARRHQHEARLVIDPVLNIVAKIEDLYTLQGAGVGRGAGRGGAEVG